LPWRSIFEKSFEKELTNRLRSGQERRFMRSTKPSLTLYAAVAVAAITFGLAVCAQAQTFTSLANFNGGNGQEPFYGSMVQATNGNYYGTTHQGGKNGGGNVFEVTPAGKLSTIYSFCAQTNCTDGEDPWSALLLGSDGNFYGTTNIGGSTDDAGTVFKMTIGGKITTLYNFCSAGCSSSGEYPVGLVEASNGNYYGATSNSGANNGGTLFEVSSTGTFKLVYSFCARKGCADGSYPLSGPMQAINGTLYGTTNTGGSHGDGVVYEITTAGLFKVLYNFCSQTGCADGQSPLGGLTQDSKGNLYGTTYWGGAYGYGTVFEITPTNEFIVLHSFDSTDGANPVAPPLQASDGNFYGTTGVGGISNGGTIYEITSAGVFSSLYSFCTASSCVSDEPGYALAQATNGEFLGATIYGGTSGYGTVYTYATGLGAFVKTVPVAAKAAARVIILGNGLTGSTSVTFNGTAATFTVVSNTEITATVPTGATTGAVEVTTPSGTLKSNPAFQVLP
jgi:uncharacterized repeat protein (TIGR03803 family)